MGGGCLLHQSPELYDNVFLLVDLTILGSFIEFLLVVSFSWVGMYVHSSPLSYPIRSLHLFNYYEEANIVLYDAMTDV